MNEKKSSILEKFKNEADATAYGKTKDAELSDIF
jgi:hypothetical protein